MQASSAVASLNTFSAPCLGVRLVSSALNTPFSAGLAGSQLFNNQPSRHRSLLHTTALSFFLTETQVESSSTLRVKSFSRLEPSAIRRSCRPAREKIPFYLHVWRQAT